MKTTLGQLLISEALPEGLRDSTRVLDKAGQAELLSQVALRYPEQYVKVSKALADIGRRIATESGGNSFGLEHLAKSKAGRKISQEVQAKLARVLDDDSLSDEQRHQLIVRTVGAYQSRQMDEVYEESLKDKSPLARQVISGSRGNKMNLSSLRGSDMLYADHHDNVIPLPVLRSYSEGLTPAEYWAGSYGARKGIMATKFCIFEAELVLMADFTEKMIGDIVVGDFVMTLNAAGKLVPTRVVGVSANGLRPCRLFKFRLGRSQSFLTVTATDDHRFYAMWRRSRTGEVMRQMVPLGEAGAARRSAILPIGCAGGRPEPRSGLVGLLLGDGGLTQANTHFFTTDASVVAAVTREAEKFSLRVALAEERYDEAGCSRYALEQLGSRAGIGGGHKGPFRSWLQELGMLGKHAHEKALPEQVWGWDEESCARLAAWLFETDGWHTFAKNQDGKSYPTVGFGSTSLALVEGLRKLLWAKLGVYAGPVSVITRAGTSSYIGARKVTHRHDVHGFVIATRSSVGRVCAFWRGTGSKADGLAKAPGQAEALYENDLPARFVSSTSAGFLKTCDIEVADPTHRFVLANGLAVSNSTQEAGFLSKQLNQVSHRLVVTGHDHPTPLDHVRGLPVDVDDMDSEGSLLAHDIGPYKRNTVLSPKILKSLKELGHQRILVRSPLTSNNPDGGLYAMDVGVRERGTLPGKGEAVGLTAAQALSEPLSQGQLSAKHSGGVAGQEKAVSGFAAVNQLIQVPDAFKGGAAHATVDGRVENIESAPAGGHYLAINGKRHYVGPGLGLKIKKGDEVEAGDVLSDGWPNPALVVEHKGIGEGRRYFVHTMKEAMQGAGIKAHRRNLELLSRGLINHVRLTEETDHHVPDDVVPYSLLEQTYQPREGHQALAPARAIGQYLEKPVLHYTVGTRVRPSVVKDLAHFGVKEITTHPEPPPFQPEMVRGMASLQHDPDWMTRMYGAGLKKSLLESVHRGGTSDELGTSFVPSLARAVDFGRIGHMRPPGPGPRPEQAPLAPAIKPSGIDEKKKATLAKWSADKRAREKRAVGPAQPRRQGGPGASPAPPPAPPAPPPQPQPPAAPPTAGTGLRQPAPAAPAAPYSQQQDYVAGTASANLPGPGATTADIHQHRDQFGLTQTQYGQAQHALGVLTGQQFAPPGMDGEMGGGMGGQGHPGFVQGYRGPGMPGMAGYHPGGGAMPGQWTGMDFGGQGGQGGQGGGGAGGAPGPVEQSTPAPLGERPRAGLGSNLLVGTAAGTAGTVVAARQAVNAARAVPPVPPTTRLGRLASYVRTPLRWAGRLLGPVAAAWNAGSFTHDIMREGNANSDARAENRARRFVEQTITARNAQPGQSGLRQALGLVNTITTAVTSPLDVVNLALNYPQAMQHAGEVNEGRLQQQAQQGRGLPYRMVGGRMTYYPDQSAEQLEALYPGQIVYRNITPYQLGQQGQSMQAIESARQTREATIPGLTQSYARNTTDSDVFRNGLAALQSLARGETTWNAIGPQVQTRAMAGLLEDVGTQERVPLANLAAQAGQPVPAVGQAEVNRLTAELERMRSFHTAAMEGGALMVMGPASGAVTRLEAQLAAVRQELEEHARVQQEIAAERARAQAAGIAEQRRRLAGRQESVAEQQLLSNSTSPYGDGAGPWMGPRR